MPIPQVQFFTSTGAVCSGCFLYTYLSGNLSTLEPTYTDYTGTVLNTNPIVLNAGGYPQTSIGTQVGVWLTPTITYTIILQSAAHIQLWRIDGVSGALPGIISSPITILNGTCNQLTVGLTGFQTGLCFPAPAANITLTFPNVASDTMVARTSTDNLSNKNLISPQFNSGACPIVNGPGTYVCAANANPTGTITNGLAIYANAPSQLTIPAGGQANGILGICVSGCGSTGNGVIQQSGQATCLFDNATTANDWVVASTGSPGACHDSGSAPPSKAPNGTVGQVQSTNGSAGNATITLGTNSGSSVTCALGTPVTVNASTTSPQVLHACQFSTAALNSVGKMFRISSGEALVAQAGDNSSLYLSFGTSSSITGPGQALFSSGATGQSPSIGFSLICTVTSSGASGALTCNGPLFSSVGNLTNLPISFSGANLTGTLWVGTYCQFNIANAGNTCTEVQLTVEQLN